MKKVLVVDDISADIERMRGLLEKDGHEVLAATNGANALDLLTSTKVDLVLLDIKMPTLSGYDLLRLLRERYKDSMKIVYVTIVPEKEIDRTGSDDLIHKPFSDRGFMEVVSKALGENASNAAEIASSSESA